MYEVNTAVYQGPFQVLLALITSQRVDVCDVPIAKLTSDFLEHISDMERSDLDVTTEFMVVAATLLALKSRALLPRPVRDDDPEDEVERDLLIARLLEVRTFQASGGHLAELLTVGDRRHAPRPASDDEALRQLPTLAGVDPDHLGRVLVEMIADLRAAVDTSNILVDHVSTEEAGRELSSTLASGPMPFHAIADGRSVSWRVALFLAMLEMAMRGEVVLSEGHTVGDLQMRLPAA